MKAVTIATIIAMAVTFVTAAPAAEAGAELERRSTTNVYLCTNQDFEGACTTLVVGIGGGCYNFPAGYNDKVSSLKTGGPNTQCYFYTNGGCTGNVFATSGPNPTVPGNYNDDLSSVHC